MIRCYLASNVQKYAAAPHILSTVQKNSYGRHFFIQYQMSLFTILLLSNSSVLLVVQYFQHFYLLTAAFFSYSNFCFHQYFIMIGKKRNFCLIGSTTFEVKFFFSEPHLTFLPSDFMHNFALILYSTLHKICLEIKKIPNQRTSFLN